MDPMYRIGIEMEFLLSPIEMSFGPTGRLRSIADYIIARCNPDLSSTAQIRNRVDKPCRRPQYWSLKKDDSVISEQWNTFPFELVSPILDYNEANPWRGDLREIYDVLSKVCNITTNSSCGVHIHISRGVAPWNLRTVKELCRNIFYFEEVINTLLPAHRVRNELIQSSRRGSEVLQGKTARECLHVIERCVTVPQVVNAMNNRGSRYFAWNLVNLVHGGRRTVEFRQPPGADNADRVLQWAEFVVFFLHAAAMSVPFDRLSAISRSPSGLLQFLSIHEPPGSDIQAVRRLLLEPLPLERTNAE